MARVGHKKSKNGCACCKARRVKCDEKRPCSACVRLKVDCSLLHVDPLAAIAPPPAKPSNPRRRKRRSARLLGIPDDGAKSSEQQSFGSFPSMEDAVFSLHDLELMHQWTLSTAFCIPAQASTHKFFQEKLPKQGMRCWWLLHQIMALTAYHIAHLEPQRREELIRRGSWHQDHALAGFNKALNEMSRENCYNVFLTSGLLVFTSFASFLSTPEEDVSPLETLSGIATQIRGISTLRQVALDHLSNFFPNRQLMPGMATLQYDVSGVTHIAENLQHLKNQLCHMVDASAGDKSLPIVISALDEILDCVTESDSVRIMATPEARVALMWPISIDSRFLTAMGQRDEGALVLLLYYCLLLQLASRDCFFLDGWASKLSAEISGYVVNQPWVEYAQWPLAELHRLTEQMDRSPSYEHGKTEVKSSHSSTSSELAWP